jgi:hypothetical protein
MRRTCRQLRQSRQNRQEQNEQHRQALHTDRRRDARQTLAHLKPLLTCVSPRTQRYAAALQQREQTARQPKETPRRPR